MGKDSPSSVEALKENDIPHCFMFLRHRSGVATLLKEVKQLNMYREFEELALVKRFIASCLTILLVGALVALFLSSLDNYYGFRFYFVYIVIFKIPAIFVGGFLFSIIADRWIVRHLKKKGVTPFKYYYIHL